MPEDSKKHYYGGQAVIEGVMMRGSDCYAVAVRREDGQVVLTTEPLRGLAVREGWHKWPLIRGNYMLVESISLGMKALQFSADVLAAEEAAKQAQVEAEAPDEATADKPESPPGPASGEAQMQSPISRLWMVLTMVLALALGVGLFLLLPTAVPKWLFAGGSEVRGIDTQSLLFNVVEGGIRLALVVLYILVISLMKYIRRVFEYHGAEHATINCYEAGGPVVPENCMRFSPLHPRCGTAFLLVVIFVKIILGWFIGWPVLWVRMLLRLALLPPVAGLSYELLRWAGRRRNSLLARLLAGPGLLLQMLTTRRPNQSQVETAIYSLAAVAPEVSRPTNLAPAWRVNGKLQPVEEEETNGPDASSGEISRRTGGVATDSRSA